MQLKRGELGAIPRNYEQENLDLLTNLNGGNTEATSFEDNTYAASRDSLSQPANYSTGHQNVLHVYLFFAL